MCAATLFRILHIVSAVVSLLACVVLATSKGGLPPAIILLNIALIFWLLGHLLLWIISKIFGQGRKLKTDAETDFKKWPLSLLILIVLLGGVFIFGAIAIILLIVLENDCLSDMLTILAIWLPPSLCFIGILLRKPWSRVLAGGGFIALAMFVCYQIAESAMGTRTNSITEWIIAITILLLTLFVGQHILRAPRIKAFYAE
jgi:hypothetical protein